MATDPQEPARLGRELRAEGGGLDDRLGIEFLEVSAARVVARMPGDGNTQVYGTLHGGASCVLAESIGSCGAAVHAGPGRMALGIEINATHHRTASSGHITGVATRAHAGTTLATYDVVITDDRDRRICTARVTSMLRDRPSPDAFLAARGADELPHPGGTLLAHLRRVHALLCEWQARPSVRLAGLCHAFYGTDGFPSALGDVTDRKELAAVIGEDAERIVYFYAGCDRAFSYPRLAEEGAPYRDRFTGAESDLPPRIRRDLAEITAANELDLARVNDDFRAAHGRALLDLFTSWRTLLSEPAWQCVQATLACEG
jgi:uncharacterized protein (TIGR00369 family)